MPERPPLRVVNGQAQGNPGGIDYKSIAITVALTTAVSVAVTMMVQHIAGRVRRNREDHNPAPQGFLPPFVPGQMPMQGQVVIPAGASYFPPPRTEVATPSNLPPSLRVPREGRRRDHAPSPPANDVAPQWFSAFAKAQEQRFAQMEQRIAESYADDEDYADDEEATG